MVRRNCKTNNNRRLMEQVKQKAEEKYKGKHLFSKLYSNIIFVI